MLSRVVNFFAIRKNEAPRSGNTLPGSAPANNNVGHDERKPSNSERQRQVFGHMAVLGDHPAGLHALPPDERVRERAAAYRSIRKLSHARRKDRFYLASRATPGGRQVRRSGNKKAVPTHGSTAPERSAAGYGLDKLPDMLCSYKVLASRWHDPFRHKNRALVAAIDSIHAHAIPEMLSSLQEFIRTDCRIVLCPEAVFPAFKDVLTPDCGEAIMERLSAFGAVGVDGESLVSDACMMHDGKYQQVWQLSQKFAGAGSNGLFDHISTVTLTRPVSMRADETLFAEGAEDTSYLEGVVRAKLLQLLMFLEPGQGVDTENQLALKVYTMLQEVYTAHMLAGNADTAHCIARNVRCGIAARCRKRVLTDKVVYEIRVVPYVSRQAPLFTVFNVMHEEGASLQDAVLDQAFACTQAETDAKQMAVNATLLLYIIDILRTLLACHKAHAYPFAMLDSYLLGYDNDHIPYSQQPAVAGDGFSHMRFNDFRHILVLPRDYSGNLDPALLHRLKQLLFETHPAFAKDVAAYLRAAPQVEFTESDLSSLTLSQACLIYALLCMFAEIGTEDEFDEPANTFLNTSPQEFWGAALRAILEDRLDEECARWVQVLRVPVNAVPNPDREQGGPTRIQHLHPFVKATNPEVLGRWLAQPYEFKGPE